MGSCGWQLRVLEGPSPGAILPLEGSMVSIGRAPAQAQPRAGWIYLQDDTVSGVQAEVHWQADGQKLRLINRSQTNPSKVNELQVAEADLKPGDQIRLGHCLLVVEAPPVGAPTPEVEAPKIKIFLGDDQPPGLFGFEQKRFWREALDRFLSSTLLDAAMVLLPEPGGRRFKVLEVRGASPQIERKQALLLALAPQLEIPSALVDEEWVLLLAPLRVNQRIQAVLCGLRQHSTLPFSSNDLQIVSQMAQQMLTMLAEHEPDPAPPEPPRRSVSTLVANRYEKGLKILQGRFTALYGAFDRETGDHVLLRKLEGPEVGREARQHLLTEGRFLSQLEHRNLPRFITTVDDESGLYLVLEAFSGSTLEQKMEKRKEPISPGLLTDYLQQFLDVLEFLHGQNPPLIQRDLRPDNILSTSDEVLKLLDFGLARLKDSPNDPRQTFFRGFGDPVYASPEQLKGDPSQPSHDLYSVGSILYFLASGEAPPRSANRWEGSSLEVPLTELRPDLPQWLAQVVDDMRQPQEEQRFRTVSEIRARI